MRKKKPELVAGALPPFAEMALTTIPAAPAPVAEKHAWVPSVGDVVYLRSGSQRLTITQVLPEGMAAVVWMAYESQDLHRDTLPAAALDFSQRKAP